MLLIDGRKLFTETEIVHESTGVLADAIKTQRIVHILDSKNRKTILAFFMERKLAESVIDKARSCAYLYADYYDANVLPASKEYLDSKVREVLRGANVDSKGKNLSDLKQGLIHGLRKIFRGKPLVWKYRYKNELLAWKFDPQIPVRLARLFHEFSYQILENILTCPTPCWVAASNYFALRVHEEKWDIFALKKWHREWSENFSDLLRFMEEHSALASGDDEGSVKNSFQKAGKKTSRRLTLIEKEDIRKSYCDEGMGIGEIAARKEVSEQTVRNVLDNWRVPRKRQKHRSERYNEEWGEHNLEANEPDGKQDA